MKQIARSCLLICLGLATGALGERARLAIFGSSSQDFAHASVPTRRATSTGSMVVESLSQGGGDSSLTGTLTSPSLAPLLPEGAVELMSEGGGEGGWDASAGENGGAGEVAGEDAIVGFVANREAGRLYDKQGNLSGVVTQVGDASEPSLLVSDPLGKARYLARPDPTEKGAYHRFKVTGPDYRYDREYEGMTYERPLSQSQAETYIEHYSKDQNAPEQELFVPN